MAIYHHKGTHLCGPNTKFGGLDIVSIQGVGVISYSIPSLPLLPGDYLISVAVINHNDTETFDFHDRTIPLTIAPGVSHEQYGLFALNGQWQHGDVQNMLAA